MKAKKSLGQNFLMHQKTADRIAATPSLSSKDTVLEIGPGTGMLTRPLLAVAGKVIALEADGRLVERLQETFREEVQKKRLVLFHKDVREYSPSRLGAYHIVSNIPYYITGEIIRTFLSTKNKPLSMTLLVQKEVAERIARSKKESLLSLSVKAYGTPMYMFTVPRGAFVPAPNVDSAVLHITNIRKDAFASKKEERLFFEVLKAGFRHKRKLLIGNLSSFGKPERLERAFSLSSILRSARAEEVSLSSWRLLAKNLAD